MLARCGPVAGCKMLTKVARSGRVGWSARPTRAVDNKSLDASRASGLLIESLRVTWLRAAASTQPLYSARPARQIRAQVNQKQLRTTFTPPTPEPPVAD